MREWECFCDYSYYDMWLVRPVEDTQWGIGFHLANREEAQGLCGYLNKLEKKAHERDET